VADKLQTFRLHMVVRLYSLQGQLFFLPLARF
jgi:hypothetical protein